jgi:hypothetical protein
LTGGVQAGLSSREINELRGADTVTDVEGNIAGSARCELSAGPARSQEPGHVRKFHAREPGEPAAAHPPDQGVGRSGKAKAVSPR